MDGSILTKFKFNKIMSNIFDDFLTNGIFDDSDLEYGYSEEDAKAELESGLNHCMSCINFKRFMGESGMCSINETSICKNPKALIDMWDIKCDNWAINDDYNRKLLFLTKK